MVILKRDDELALMREAGRIVAEALTLIRERVGPGVTTQELDALAEVQIRKRDAIPSFKGYPNNIANGSAFPATICASINDELVHGIPDGRQLQEGDIVSIDCGAIYKGYHGDSAITLPVGSIAPEVQTLLNTTEEALYLGIAQARVGGRIGDITSAVQKRVEDQGYSVVREYTSHCIGRKMHEGFSFPNLGKAGRGMKLQRGMTIALEPMVNAGDWRTQLLDDGWTVSSLDGSLTAHFEHTIAVVDGEARILTTL